MYLNLQPLCPFTTDPASELDILRHNSDAFGVDSAQICILKEANEVGLGRLLEGGDGRALEAEVGLEVLSDLPHQPLERQFPDQKLGALLVFADLPQRHRPRPEAVGLLHAPRRRR